MSGIHAVVLAVAFQLAFPVVLASGQIDTIAQVRYPQVVFFSNEQFTSKDGAQSVRLLMAVPNGKCDVTLDV
jgi:hypothetical protein